MVPKAGSSFASTIFEASDCCQRVRHHFHDSLYRPCSIVTLREPCRRAVSAFAHLSAPKVLKPTEWPQLARNADEYVSSLATNWVRQAFVARKITFISQNRHYVVAMPQHLWIGNASKVICTDDLDEDLLPVLRRAGCCQVPKNATFARANKRVKVTAVTGRLQASAANLSSESCQLVRRLYAKDYELWQRLCDRPRAERRERAHGAEVS